MKKQLIKTLVFVLSLLVLGACNNKSQTSGMKNVTGKAGELVVVISPSAWGGAPGQALKDVLTKPQVGLPQDEPLFNLVNIPWEGYADIFKTSRNIIEVNIGSSVEKPGITFKRNVHAYTQALVILNAKDNQQLTDLIKEKEDKIVGFFLAAERERLTMNYEKYNDKEVREAVEKKDLLLLK